MTGMDALAMLAFNIKMIGRKTKKNVLISVGKPDDKHRILPALRSLQHMSVALYATPGTHRFLADNHIDSHEIYKIAAGHEPNIRSHLSQDHFDLVINIPTGDHVHEERTDGHWIRAQAIERCIPLITDVGVATKTIEQMQRGSWGVMPQRQDEPWNLRRSCLEMAKNNGGFACYHAHFDKAYLITQETLQLSQVDMQKKWDLYRYLKENYTHADLVTRISRGVEAMISQGVTHCRTFLDADSTVKLLPIQAALEVRERYRDRITLEFAVQPLQGVLDPESRKYFVQACELADIVGGLPSRDRPTPEKHLDFILDLARDLDKRIDVHIDQENNPYECETELLALKTIEHGMQGRVTGVHAISVSAKPEMEQDRILKVVKDSGMAIVVCPSAALSMKPLEMRAPLHNSIAPVPKLLQAEIPVFLGVDNIYDLFMPVVDGDMWFECRMLMESCRYYDIDRVMKLATDKRGFAIQRKASHVA